MGRDRKAKRFIQSSIREWAYAQPFQTSAERQAAMHPWLHDYNTARTPQPSPANRQSQG